MSNAITHIKSSNRRVCGINLKINNISLIVLSVCNTYSFHIVEQEYADCIDHIETILTTLNVIIVFVLEILIRALVD